MEERNTFKKEYTGYEKKSLPIRRVAKVTKGGKRLRFSTIVIVGDKKGKVGVGLGRGADVKSAVDKGERIAMKSLTSIQLIGDTIPHEITYKYGAAEVLLRPARTGTGVIAGSSVRTVLELAGIDSVYGKILGTPEPNANAYCTFLALKALRNARVLKRMSKMRERIEYKKVVDEERKKKEIKKKKAKKGQRSKDKVRTNKHVSRRN